jgi:hypothetical protein
MARAAAMESAGAAARFGCLLWWLPLLWLLLQLLLSLLLLLLLQLLVLLQLALAFFALCIICVLGVWL